MLSVTRASTPETDKIEPKTAKFDFERTELNQESRELNPNTRALDHLLHSVSQSNSSLSLPTQSHLDLDNARLTFFHKEKLQPPSSDAYDSLMDGVEFYDEFDAF